MAITKHLHGDLLDTLELVLEFLDNYVDVVDGDYGEPAPNRAMRLHSELSQCVERLERDIRREQQAPVVKTEEWKKAAIIRVLSAAYRSDAATQPSMDRLARGILFAIEERV